MDIRSIRDLAAVMRGRRKDLGMTQVELARRAGVSRKWINEFERGKPRAEFGLLLRTLDELGLALQLGARSQLPRSAPGDTIDLDVLLEEHRSDDQAHRNPR